MQCGRAMFFTDYSMSARLFDVGDGTCPPAQGTRFRGRFGAPEHSH